MNNDLQNTAQWYNERLFHFTSSELHKLLTKPKSGDSSKTVEGYIYNKIAEYITNGTCLDYNELNIKEARWGHTRESEARECYEKRTGKVVELCGFFEWSDMFGGSPDGLVGDDGIIEIKCPYNSAIHARYLALESAEEFLKLKPEYYAQIQGNLLVTKRKWCDFISYDPRSQSEIFSLKILRIYRDDKFIEKAIKALDNAELLKKQIMAKIIRLCLN